MNLLAPLCSMALAVLLVGASSPAEAQPARPLTLQEAITLAQENSPSLKAAQASFRAAHANQARTDAQMLPRFSLTGSVPGLDRSINEITQDDGSVAYIPQSRLSSNTRLAVQEQLPWTGTELYVSTRLARLDVFGNREFSQWNAAPVAIGLTQPLFQFDEQAWTRRLQPFRLKAAWRTYRGERAQLAREVAQAFADAYLARINEDLAAFNRSVNDTILTRTQRRYRIGTATKQDVLKSKLELVNAQEALSEAQSQAETARQALATQLGLDPTATLRLTLPEQLPPATWGRPTAAVKLARQRRAVSTEQKLHILQARRDLAQAKSQTGFSASITASFGLNQQADWLGGAYRHPLNQQSFNLNFDLPLFGWGQGAARVEAAQATLQQAKAEAHEEKRAMSQEVRTAAQRLPRLRRQVRLAGTADSLAALHFQAARRQYRIGNTDLTELFNAQQTRSQARRDHFERLGQFWTTYYQLRRLTLYDLAEDAPSSIKSP